MIWKQTMHRSVLSAKAARYGHLTLTILSAHGLVASDLDGASDPYCRVQMLSKGAGNVGLVSDGLQPLVSKYAHRKM